MSDDTQMTLFTANGLMFGVTRWANYGGLADLPSYVMEAYKEWYQTQTKVKDYNAFHTCWIRDIKELNVVGLQITLVFLHCAMCMTLITTAKGVVASCVLPLLLYFCPRRMIEL